MERPPTDDFDRPAGAEPPPAPCFASNAEARAYLEKSFGEVFGPNASRDVYAKYFHPDYVQTVDGKVLDYAAAMHHLDVVNAATASVEIVFDKVLVSGAWIAESHSVAATLKDGQVSNFTLIALMRLEGRRIIELEELTHQTGGDTQARDLGSRV